MVAIHGSVVKSPLHSRCAFNSRVVGNPYLTGLRKGCPSFDRNDEKWVATRRICFSQSFFERLQRLALRPAMQDRKTMQVTRAAVRSSDRFETHFWRADSQLESP